MELLLYTHRLVYLIEEVQSLIEIIAIIQRHSMYAPIWYCVDKSSYRYKFNYFPVH